MISLGIIGTGGIARAHAPGWLAHAQAIYLYSLQGAEEFARELEQMQERNPGLTGGRHVPIQVCSQLPEMLESVEAVDICTPTDTHAELARQALEAGLDVLCEKPLARTLDQAEEIASLAHSCHRTLYPAHVVRFFPAYVQAKKAVERGEIGQLAVCRFRRAGSYPSWSSWFADEERSGGLVMDLAIHDLDQALWIAGPVDTVYATLAHAQGEGDLPIEMLDCTLTHSSGTVSQVQAIWGPPGMRFTTEFSLAGTTGKLSYASAHDLPISTNGGSDGATTIPSSSSPSPYTAEIEDFLATRAHHDHEPVVSAIDGIAAIRLAQAVARSIQTNSPVTCHNLEVA